MEVLDRNKFAPIVLYAGDSLTVTQVEKGWFGRKKILAQTTIAADRAMTYDEAVLFATTFEGRRALGGMILEKQ